MTKEQRENLEGMQLTMGVIDDLESFADGLRRAHDDGSLVVSYGVREDTHGEMVITVWNEVDKTEEYLYPGEVLIRINDWLNELPDQPPAEDVP